MPTLLCRGAGGASASPLVTYEGALDIDHVVVTKRIRSWDWEYSFGPAAAAASSGGAREDDTRGRKVVASADTTTTAQGVAPGGWWVHCGDEGHVTVCNLRAPGGPCGVRCEWAYECHAVFCNKCVVGEAVIVGVLEGHGQFLAVVDLEKSYAVKKLAVVCLIQWVPPCDNHFASGVAMWNSESGKRLLFVEVHDARILGCVYKFEEGCKLNDFDGANLVPISRGTRGISQLTSSLFCISTKNYSVEIWDCNSIAPLRSIEARAGVCSPVVAESGFLFHQCDIPNHAVEVTDLEGHLTVTLKLPSRPMQWHFTRFESKAML
ncbi:hypothetical protein Pelo_12245 [Pelomyxa schiedti]|nr:hypothetical protein Pelo_12245 [Pelomyxa schiedti]